MKNEAVYLFSRNDRFGGFSKMLMNDDAPSFSPQKHVSAYHLFAERNIPEIRQQNPSLSEIDIIMKVSSMWSALPTDQRVQFYETASRINPLSTFGFEDQPVKHLDAQQAITEATANAALQIAEFPQPTNNSLNYILWVGASTVAQYINSHGQIPSDLAKYVMKGTYLSQHSNTDLTTLAQQMKQNQNGENPQ